MYLCKLKLTTMHQYALGTYSKGKAHNKKRAEIAMIKNNIREMDKTKTRLERSIIKKIDDLEKMWQDIQLNISNNSNNSTTS